MDTQQIRELAEGWAEVSPPTSDAGVMVAYLLEYADLLDNSQRIWWCPPWDEVGDERCSEKEPHNFFYPNGTRHCGWRLLAPIGDRS